MGSGKRTAVSDPSSSKQGSTTSHKRLKRPQHKKHPSVSSASALNALPGVQKIKAAIRQTRRLLAKDSLAADVRVTTERRLKSLEADLAKAEQARLERAMATRYHKVKFFERQKVVRKLNQTKRKLASSADEEGGDEGRADFEARLAELRVDLNYILHYPKTKKYISLFPPEVRQAKKGEQSAAEVARAAKEAKERSETHRQREEIRSWIRAQMDSGDLSWEPEVELEKSERRAASRASKSMPSMAGPSKAQGKGTKAGGSAETSSGKGSKAAGIAGDGFFSTADDEDEDNTQDTDEAAESDDDGDMEED
ncbi:hypothetical protein BN946_scf184813.g18 [Trametes cinnabarina]|uniref:rRNA-processing protein EFG1 n=1 Tax=Pycnoporus cinnabarinus TaxID=5643 RepID=A0A060SW84_PYCCI|nr:hypothetical protein BN946_scf184813.g18 [Trametes cinnabarina]